MSESVGKINLDLEVNHDQFNNQIKEIGSNAESSLGGIFKNLGETIAAAFAVDKLFEFGKESIRLASNLNEVQNVVDVTFGNMSEEINKFTDNAITQFGMSDFYAKKFTSIMGAMLKSSGFTGQGLVDMSEGITTLAGNMASFYNISQEDAFDKLRSGMMGMIRPLEEMGIKMTEVDLKNFALAKGFKVPYQSMDQATQTLVRYNYIMAHTKDIQGDYARTSQSWANQTRLLSQEWDKFKETLGSGLINILSNALKGFNAFILKIQVAAEYFKAFTSLVFGDAQATSKSTDSTNKLADATTKAGDAAATAAKKVSGSLGSFDQLNIIGQKAADALGGVSDNLGDVGSVDLGKASTGKNDAEVDPNKLKPMKDMLDNIKSTYSQIAAYLKDTFAPTFSNVLGDFKPIIDEFKMTLGKVFKDISTLGAPLKSWITSDLIPFWQNSISKMYQIGSGLFESVIKVFNDIETTVMPILQNLITKGLPFLTSFSMGASDVFMSIFNLVKFVFDTIYSGVISPVLKLLSKIIVDTLNIIYGFWNKFGKDIVKDLVDTFNSVKTIFSSLWNGFLGPVWTYLVQQLTWFWNKHLKGLVESLTNFIGILVTAVLEILNKFILPLIDFLVKLLAPGFTVVFRIIIDIILTLLAVISDAVQGIMEYLGGVIDFLTGIFTGNWGKAWKGIEEIFTGSINFMTGIMKGFINIIIDGINLLIRDLNLIKIPDLELPGIGKISGFGFNIPEIPKLASGGLISAPTLAMVGDNRNARMDPEVVSPLSQLQNMMNSSNQGIIQVLMMILNAIEQQVPTLEIDGQKLSRILKQYNLEENNRTGKRMVTVGGIFV